MLGHQRKPGAGAGREIGGAAGSASAAGNAFQSGQKILQEVGGLLQTLPAQTKAGVHVHAEGRLRAAYRPGLVVLKRLVRRLHHPRGSNTEALLQRVLERLHALVQHIEIDARDLRPEARGAAGKAGDRREIADLSVRA